jgi:hypothetical protein
VTGTKPDPAIEAQAAHAFSGPTLDSWAWIAKARAAASRAVAPASPPTEVSAEPAAGPSAELTATTADRLPGATPE